MPFFKKEDPLPDMSRFDKDQTAVESGNKFTVSDWEKVTEGWQPYYKTLVEVAKRQNYLVRSIAARELRKKAESGELNAEPTNFTADIFSLQDDALERLYTALEINERAGKLAKPPKKKGGLLSRFRK